MINSGRRKRKKLSSSSSIEGPSTVQDKEGEVSDSKMPAGMVTEDSVNETPSLADVWKVFTEIKTNMDKGQVDFLVKENKGLKSKVKYLKEQVKASKKELEDMEQRLDEVEAKHDDLEQYTQKFNLVIHGIPEREEEDNIENVIKLGKLLEVNLSSGDIDIVHRMKTKNKDKPRPIIARFCNYNAKSKLYKARLNLRNVDLQDLGAEKIIINENLTAWRAELFKEARKVKRKHNNGKTWTVNGKIFLKTDLTAKVLKIDSYEDLKAL